MGARQAGYQGEEDAVSAFRGPQALGTTDPLTSLDQGSRRSSNHRDRDEHGVGVGVSVRRRPRAQGFPVGGEGAGLGQTHSWSQGGWRGMRLAWFRGRSEDPCLELPWAERWSSLPVSVLPSRVCRSAGKFMRTGLFSGVLAPSLHVLIGTREAVSANVFVP